MEKDTKHANEGVIDYKSPRPYPFMHPKGTIFYVSKTNHFMQVAKQLAEDSGCVKQATGAVIVLNGQIVASGSNAGLKVSVCPRIIEKCATGTGYHFCKEICKQLGHAEVMAVADFKKQGLVGETAELYLWGHWWCCEACWNEMIDAGITTVYLQEGATEEFDLDAAKVH